MMMDLYDIKVSPAAAQAEAMQSIAQSFAKLVALQEAQQGITAQLIAMLVQVNADLQQQMIDRRA